MTDYDFKMHTGNGQAVPVFANVDLIPAIFDESLGSVEAREAWATANAEGAALAAVLAAKTRAFREERPLRSFVDRDAFLFASAQHVAEETAAVNAATRRSAKALTNYRLAQRRNPVNLRAVARDVFMAEDRKARTALADAERAFLAREEAARFTGVRAEDNAMPGRGHFIHSWSLGTAKSPDAKAQWDAVKVVVDVAPRALIAEAIAKEATA